MESAPLCRSFEGHRPGVAWRTKCVYYRRWIHITRVKSVRTNIEIDDELLSQAMTAAGLSTKRATVEEGLRLLVQVRGQTTAFAELRGLGWEGNLDEMRDGS